MTKTLTEQEIMKRICDIGSALDFNINNNIDKIAKIKSRMDCWRDCPCDHFNPLRYCGSKLCEEDTLRDGHCHCNLFLKGK